MKLFALALLAAASVASAQVVNPDVTQANINKTICVPGWTATIRPPSSYTNRLKVQLVKESLSATDTVEDYELDHVIPLSVGGHPVSPQNLKLQPWDGPNGAHAKDVVEVRVKRLVCARRITLAQGQACFKKGWRTCPTK